MQNKYQLILSVEQETAVRKVNLASNHDSGVSLSFCAGGQWGFSARHF